MNLQTISNLLKEAEINFIVYDMGRRIQRLSPQDFLRFENGELAYPSPLQQHAWIGLVGWRKDDKTQHFIWFLKLPLDELGQVNPVARDEVINYLLNQIHNRLLLKTSSTQANEDPETGELPHGFTPKEESMAVFHAKASNSLNQPASQYYQHAHDYLAGNHGYDQWAFVAMQGLADVIVRLDENNNMSNLRSALANLPDIPYGQLCRFLEHESLPAEFALSLIDRAEQKTSNNENLRNNRVATIRALSGVENKQARQAYIQEILTGSMADDIEILAAISGRCWQDLAEPQLAQLFLDALATNNQGQVGFEHTLVDLLAIPGMRDGLMTVIRNPKRSEKLSQAIGQFFSKL